MAFVVWTDGTTHEIDDDKVPEALSRGFKTIDQAAEEDVAGTHTADAAMGGFARGALPVLGTYAEKKAFEESLAAQGASPALIEKKTAEFMNSQNQIKTQNPLASGLGELAGSFATAPVLGAAGKGAVALSGVKSKLGAAAIDFGVQGGAMGLASTADEALLTNQPLTVEKAALGMLAGGVSGAGLGAGLSLVGKGASALTKKVLGEIDSGSFRESLKAKAADLELGMLLNKRALDKMPAKHKADMIEFAHKEGILGRAGTALDEKTVGMATAAQERIGTEMGEALNSLDPAKFDGEAFKAAVSGALDKYRVNGVYDSAVARVEKIAESATRKGFNWQEAWTQQEKLNHTLKGMAEDDVTKEVFKAAQLAAREHIATAADAAGAKANLSELSRKYAIASNLSDNLENQFNAFTARGMGGFKELAAAAPFAAAGNVVGALKAAGVYVLGHEGRRRGGFVGANVLRKLADSGMLDTIGSNLKTQVLDRLGTGALDRFESVMANAVARGAADTLAEHMNLANGPDGEEYLARMGMEAETPDQQHQVGQKLAVLSHLHEAEAAHDEKVQAAISGFISAPPGAPARMLPKRSKSDFAAKRDEITALAHNPESAFDLIPHDLQIGAPATANLIADKYVKAAQFLESKLPKDPNAGLPKGLQRPWEPSSTDVAQFYRYVDAVENHEKVIQEIQKGQISREHAEALKELFPEVFNDLKEKLAARLAEVKEPLPYQKRVGLSYILGENALGLQGPNLKMIQQMHAKSNEKPQGKPPDGRQNVSAVENMATQAQRIEGR